MSKSTPSTASMPWARASSPIWAKLPRTRTDWGYFPSLSPAARHGVWVLVDGEQAPCGQLLHNGLGVAAAPP